MTRLCTFALADRLLAIDADQIREIVTLRDLTAVPGSPRHVRGLVNLRGQIVACIDLGVLLAFDCPPTSKQLAVVVADGDELVSMAVDRVVDVIELDPADIEPVPPTVPRVVADSSIGIYQGSPQLLLILDLGHLLEVSSPRLEVS